MQPREPSVALSLVSVSNVTSSLISARTQKLLLLTDLASSHTGDVAYPDMSKTLEKEDSKFILNVVGGTFKGAEMIGLLGQNGCGKTTFMELLAGQFDQAATEEGASKKVEILISRQINDVCALQFSAELT